MNAAAPALAAATVAMWLSVLHGDSPGLLHICATDDWTGRTFPTDRIDAATDYVTGLDAAGREGIYARITTLKAPLAPGRRGGWADSLALPALWGDLDLAGPGHAETNLPPDTAAGRKLIDASGLPKPTLWVHSGGGLYPIWLLDKPHVITDDIDDVKDLAAGWQAVIEKAAGRFGWHYGRGVGDLSRVLRIPGTVNRKAKLARPCHLLSATAHRYPIGELYDALAVALPASATPETTPPVRPPQRDGLTPGDDWAQRTDWAQILEPHDWTLSHHRDQIRYWTRPGKRVGISATTNALGTDRLHVFSTSTALDADTSYSKFGALAVLEHGGDHSAAAAALARQGYGTPRVDPATRQRDALHDLVGGPSAVLPSPTPTNPNRYFDRDEGLLVATLATDVVAAGPLAEGIDDITWSYRDGVWMSDRHVVRHRVAQLLGQRFRRSHLVNTEDVVRSMIPTITCEPVSEIINFRNGVYLWQADQLRPHDPAVLSTVQLPIDYDPDATCPRFDEFLAQVVPADMVSVMWELTGYLMYSGNPLHKAAMFSGHGRNGKGTYLRTMTALLGRRNISAVSLHDLANTRFSTASLFGKIANIAGDIDGTYLESTATFKAITGQDLISAEHKGRDRFDFTPWAVPVFSANKIPPASDATVGYLSRWLVLPFPNDFTGREDRGLDDRLQAKQELQGIAAKAVIALRTLMARGDFEMTASALEARAEFARHVDQIQTWTHSCAEIDVDLPFVPRTELYTAYKNWASRDGYKPLKAGDFYDRLEAIPGCFSTRHHGGVRGFTGIRVTDSAPPEARENWWQK